MSSEVIYYQGRRYARRFDRTILDNRTVITALVNRKDPGTFAGTLVSERTVWRSTPLRATPSDAGCYVDGHWGQYAIAHMIQRAQEFGYDDAQVIDLADRHLASMMPSGSEPLPDDEHEALICASDEVECWLNENIAPDGYSFGWYEGEFFLWSTEQWECE